MIPKHIWRTIALKTIVFTTTFGVFLSQLSIGWGLLLLNPYWDTFSSSIGFSIMARLMHENLWGALLTVMGIRLYYAEKRNSLQQRRDTLFGMFILWGFITTTIILANYRSTGSIVYPLILWYTFRAYLATSQQYKFRSLEL